MSTQDAIGKRYMSDNAIFADAFNFLIYNGEPVIKPEKLSEADTAEIALPYGNDARLAVPDPRLYRVIPNYFVNLLAPARIDDAEFAKFNTELGVALKLLKYQDKGIGQAIRDLNHRKVSRLTAEFVNAQAKLNLVFEEPKEEGEIDMCKAMEDLIREEREDAAEKTLLQAVKNLMKNFNLTLDQAFVALNVPATERSRLEALL